MSSSSQRLRTRPRAGRGHTVRLPGERGRSQPGYRPEHVRGTANGRRSARSCSGSLAPRSTRSRPTISTRWTPTRRSTWSSLSQPPHPPDYEAIKAEAWREGFHKGYDEGVHLAAQEQQATTARLGALIHGIATDTEQFVRSLKADIIELVLAVAEKVIAREVRTDRGIVVNVVRAALAEVHDATELRIRVHPEDYALLEPRWQEMLPRSVAEQSELLSDELVERGGCAVETRIGYVDSQLKTRLSQIVNAFQGVLDGEPA